MATEKQSEPEQAPEQENKPVELNTVSVKKMLKSSVGLLTFVMLWSIAGIVAFIISIYCFTKSGTTGEKILGLILAMILGPIYFIYAAINDKYCK